MNTPSEEEAWVDDLRAIVKGRHDEWRDQMNTLIGEGPDPLRLQAMRVFLNSHLPRAADAVHERMSAMIALLSGKLCALGSDPVVVTKLVERIAGLQEELGRLSETLQSGKDALAAIVGLGRRQTVGRYAVHIGHPHPFLRVLDKAKVPLSFQTPQPDRRLIMQHFKSTGEVPTGVEIRESRPSVTVKALQNS